MIICSQVAHEVLALQILTLLLETPTDDSVEIAISFLKESGQKLCEVISRACILSLRIFVCKKKMSNFRFLRAAFTPSSRASGMCCMSRFWTRGRST